MRPFGPLEQVTHGRSADARRDAKGMHRFLTITELSHVGNATLATALVVPFEHLRMTDVESVGGKNASLGEMISQLAAAGVRVPGGFATTAHAFRDFSRHSGLTRARSPLASSHLDIDDVRALAAAGSRDPALGRRRPVAARRSSRSAQRNINALTAEHPGDSLRRALVGHGRRPARRLVRRPAGDLPERRPASTTCCDRIKHVFASLYNDRAISYRVHKGFAHADVALSAGVQRMVRSDLGSAGVMFTHRSPNPASRDVGVHHVQLRAGRDGGAGRREPRRVLRAQARC